MAQVTQEMASEYDRIYGRASEDPGTAGDEGEENWAALFREWLPSSYHIETKGRLIGHDGRMSPQIDLLVLKPAYPRKLRDKKVWMAGGVAAAFECKTTLTAKHIRDSVARCVKFKEIVENRTGTPSCELKSPLFYGLLAHSHSWKGPNSKPLANVAAAFDGASASIAHPSLLLDTICVADLATWIPIFATCYRADWVPESQSALEALFGGPWGVTTSMNCATASSDQQESTFRPIGPLIGIVTQALARNDLSVRDIADYFRKANLWGSSSGIQRHWPASVYSADVIAGINAGRLTNGGTWDAWSLGLI